MKMVRAPHIVRVYGRVPGAVQTPVCRPAAWPAELEVAFRTRNLNTVRVEYSWKQKEKWSQTAEFPK